MAINNYKHNLNTQLSIVKDANFSGISSFTGPVFGSSASFTGILTAGGSVYWGSSASRTETKSDAGTIASKSGFFETSVPTNYYTGASGWQHLIEARHSNDLDNYALQIAGSFFDQNLYFRKTNDNGATAWSRFIAENSSGNVGIGTLSPTSTLTNFGSFATGLTANTLSVTNDADGIVRMGPSIISTPTGTSRLNLQDRQGGYLSFYNGTTLVGRFAAYTSTDLSLEVGTANTERIRIIAATGNIGIGTTNPAETLHLLSSSGRGRFQETGTGANFSILINPGQAGGPRISIGSNGDSSFIDFGAYNNTNNLDTKARDLRIFSTAAPNAFTLRQDTGSIGLGTTNPFSGQASGLDVNRGGAVIQARNIGTTGDTSVWAADENFYSAPSYKGVGLRKYGTGVTGNFIQNIPHADLGQLSFQNTTNALIYTNGQAPIIFATNSAERLRIDGLTGNVGIGSTTSPGATLDVVGGGRFTGIVTAQSFRGDGSQLTGVASTSGITIRDDATTIGVATIIDFGSNLTVSTLVAGIVTVTGAAGGGGGVSSQWVSTATGVTTTSNVGIGTTNVLFKVDVDGDVRVRSQNKVRFGGTSSTTNFYIQYNSSTNSLDFISG